MEIQNTWIYLHIKLGEGVVDGVFVLISVFVRLMIVDTIL